MKDTLYNRILQFKKDVLDQYPQLHIWIEQDSNGSYWINHDNKQLQYFDEEFHEFVGELYYKYFKDDDLFDVSFSYETPKAGSK